MMARVREVANKAIQLGVKPLSAQRGQTLPKPHSGHEHFGFKDGVSQPAVRGRASSAPTDFITPRYIDPARDPQRALLFAKPGQPLVSPGQFLLGEQRQHTEDLHDAALELATNFPL